MRLPEVCVSCEKDYWECRKYVVYKLVNIPCYFCGNIRNVRPFALSTGRGIVSVYVCEVCMTKLC